MKRRYFTRSIAASENIDISDDDIAVIPKKRRRLSARSSRNQENKRKSKNQSIVESIQSDTSIAVVDFSKNGKKENSMIVKTNINYLSNDILVKIFEYVDLADRIRIERVSRRWNAVARNLSWIGTNHLDYAVISRGWNSFMDNDGKTGLYQLRSRIRARPINKDILRQLLVRCGAYLKRIDLSGYRDKLDHRALGQIGINCPGLQSINLTGIWLTISSLYRLASGCPNLRSIVFQRCFRGAYMERALSDVFISCRMLKSLNLSENEHLTGQSFSDLPPTLLHLSLSQCDGLTEEAMMNLFDRCPSLEVLHMDFSEWITGPTLRYIFDHASQLRIFDMNYIASTLNQVQNATAFVYVLQLSNLTELYLSHNCLVYDATVCGISQGCTNLKILDISENTILTNHSLISLGKFVSRTLTHLNVGDLPNITDFGVKHLKYCNNLETLVLSQCPRITNNALYYLAPGCTGLRQLDISFCHSVTSEGIISFHQKRYSVWALKMPSGAFAIYYPASLHLPPLKLFVDRAQVISDDVRVLFSKPSIQFNAELSEDILDDWTGKRSGWNY